MWTYAKESGMGALRCYDCCNWCHISATFSPVWACTETQDSGAIVHRFPAPQTISGKDKYITATTTPGQHGAVPKNTASFWDRTWRDWNSKHILLQPSALGVWLHRKSHNEFIKPHTTDSLGGPYISYLRDQVIVDVMLKGSRQKRRASGTCTAHIAP